VERSSIARDVADLRFCGGSHIRMATRIIGIGNTILSDDGVGVYAAREVSRRIVSTDIPAKVDVVESEVGGFALMELMAGWQRVILVDSIQFDHISPGSVIRIEPQDLKTSLKLRSVHEIDLPTALELGRRLGFDMPREVVIFGIQAEDAWTLGESLTAAGKRGMQEAVEQILKEIDVQAIEPAGQVGKSSAPMRECAASIH
jgi:hydrogenase maturation protease